MNPTIKRRKTLHRKRLIGRWADHAKLQTSPKLAKLKALSDGEWERGLVSNKTLREAFYGENTLQETLQWEILVDQMTKVQWLVFSIMMYRDYDIEVDAAQLLHTRILSFEDEVTLQAMNVGCLSRSANLTNVSIRQELKAMSDSDASSIANTYNYDVARAIIRIGNEKPSANRYVYAANLEQYLTERDAWKAVQIAQQTDLSARALAKFWFYTLNHALGDARLFPREASCDVCKGWVTRGTVPLRVALAHQPPYHPGCPHEWEVEAELAVTETCERLWMGE